MAQAPFILNPALVAMVQDYSRVNGQNRGYIADRVAVRVRVDGPTFKWQKFPIEEAFTVYDDQIDRLGRANEITSSSTEEAGATVDHALREPVPYRDEMAARAANIPLQLRARAAYKVWDKIQLNREIRVAALTMSMANYSTGYKTDLSAGTKWSDFANSDPIADIKAAMRKMIFPGNVGITSQAVADILSRHPKTSVALGGSAESGRHVPLQEVANLLGLSRIEIGSTIKQTSKRGQAHTVGDVWSDSFAIHYQGATDVNGFGLDADSPNFLTTFQWGDIVASEQQVAAGDMGLWGGVKVLAGESVVEKQVSPLAGYLFNQVL